MEKYSRAGKATDDNMAHAHCMLVKNAFSGYVILTALPQQELLHESASLLRYTYMVSLVLLEF